MRFRNRGEIAGHRQRKFASETSRASLGGNVNLFRVASCHFVDRISNHLIAVIIKFQPILLRIILNKPSGKNRPTTGSSARINCSV